MYAPLQPIFTPVYATQSTDLTIRPDDFTPLYPSSTTYAPSTNPKLGLSDEEIMAMMNPPKKMPEDNTQKEDRQLGLGNLLLEYSKILARPNLGAPQGVIDEDDNTLEEEQQKQPAYFTPPKTKNTEMEARINIGISAIVLSVLSISITLLVLHFLKINIRQAASSTSGIEFFTLTGLVGLAGMIEYGHARAHLYK